MTLPDFIAEIGDDKASEIFMVPKRTVQSWRRRERCPRPSKASEIIAATGGRVAYAGIYALPPQAIGEVA